MKAHEFFDAIESHPELEGLGVDTEHGLVGVEYTPAKQATVLPIEAILQVDWDVLEDVLTLKREPNVIFHMTRVVGYYSRTDNWNGSKIGELKDRHKGNYALEEA